MFGFQIIFIELDSEGEECAVCKNEIKGKKWVMMVDYFDPINQPPDYLRTFCTICYIKFEKEE